MSSEKPNGYAYSSSADSPSSSPSSPLPPPSHLSSSGAKLPNSDVEDTGYEELKIGDDHTIYSERRTRTSIRTAWLRSSRGYTRRSRLVFAYTIACLSCIVLFHTWWVSLAQDADPFDNLFRLRPSETNADDRALASEDIYDRWELFMRHVLPVRCHSHNDYLRAVPLFAALASGCTSVEADVWALDGELYVGHKARALRPDATLSSMYLGPIERMLRSANAESMVGNVSAGGNDGVFGMRPGQTLVLLIDFKTDTPETYDEVYSELGSLREAGWLTHWNGTHRVERPLTIVASGSASFDQVTRNSTYRDIFFDAPLSKLVDIEDYSPAAAFDPTSLETDTSDSGEDVETSVLGFKYNPSNSYYASTNMGPIIGSLPQYSITPAHIRTLKSQIHEAKLRGLVSRYWGTPRWPRQFRDYTWGILIESDVGVLNIDDLRAARKGRWGQWAHDL